MISIIFATVMNFEIGNKTDIDSVLQTVGTPYQQPLKILNL